MLHLIAIEAPRGAVLEFALLFAVVLLGPVIVEKAKVPGIIGLLVGGYVIGSHGVGLIGSGNQTIPELGQLGLLYLMFVAGLELDLNLLKEYRKAAITFGILTFLVPFVAGVGVGLQQGWTVPASLLLGSLLASHTLILYPTIRDAGRGANPSGGVRPWGPPCSPTRWRSWCWPGWPEPPPARARPPASWRRSPWAWWCSSCSPWWCCPGWPWRRSACGAGTAARYLVSILSFLAMAMVAEVFGIEGIVGAFFAGLALNRLVPNEGPSMERIEFFGSAIFIPVFLVSVGLLLDPAVMFASETLGIAALLCLACLGGKAVAAALTRPLLGFSASEAGVMFVLTTPQAAATLAATLVGFDIGLFGTSVVNAVLVLIFVSILVSTLLADRYAARIPVPTPLAGALGERVLVAVGASGPSPAALRLVEALVASDSGVVDVVIVRTEGEGSVSSGDLRSLERSIFKGSIDGEVRTVVDRTVADAVAHAALPHQPSVVIIDATSVEVDADCDPLARHLGDTPVIVIQGEVGPEAGPVVVVADGGTSGGIVERAALIMAKGRSELIQQVEPSALVGMDPRVVVSEVEDWSALTAEPAGARPQRITVVGRH